MHLQPALLLAVTTACKVTGVFTCETSEQCRAGGVTGFCEATSYCSFVDHDCTSGHRYDETAGEGLAGLCVDGVRARMKAIAIDGSKITEALSDFPVWIDLTDPDIGKRAAPDGGDIEFTTGDGSPIAYEIQGWDAAAGRLLAWVRVASLQPGTDTVIYVRYGAPRMSSPAPAMVFTNSFLAVWHFEDALTTTMIADATGTRAGTASSSLGAAAHVTGKLGAGIRFGAAGTTDEVRFANPLTDDSGHTISVWVDALQPLPMSYSSIVTVGNPVTNESRFWHAHFATGTVAVGFYGNDWLDTQLRISAAGWTLLHWVFDEASRTSLLYRDGALVGMYEHMADIGTAGMAGYIGNAPTEWGVNFTNRVPMNGTLDEVRIASALRSAAWIATEYANQQSPSTFYRVGPEELVE